MFSRYVMTYKWATKCILFPCGPYILATLFFSAGVGRTGTFISLDALFHYARRGNNIDIPGYVHKIRRQRMNMIQTLVSCCLNFERGRHGFFVKREDL